MSSIIEAVQHVRQTVSMSALAAKHLKISRSGREWKACCPFHPDRSPSFTVYDDDRRWHCFGCGAGGDQADFVMRMHSVPLGEAIQMIDTGALPVVEREPVQREEECDRSEEARSIWSASAPIVGTPAEQYLRARGLICPLPDALRYARLRYGRSGPDHPCLVALVTGPSGQPTGIQRTFVNASGTGKAAVPKPKLSLGRIRGGAIRLAPVAPEMVVAEGLEDGLSVQQQLGAATWVAAGAGNLASMRLPNGVHSVIIASDADQTGQEQAEAAARALARQGRTVRIIRPLDGFKDFNAELMAIVA